MASLVFNSCLFDVCSGNIDFGKDKFSVLLAQSSYEPNKEHARRSDVREVIGAGYKSGGTPLDISIDKEREGVNVTFKKVQWNPATIKARYGIYYKRRGGAASRDELVAVVDFGDEVSSTNGSFIVTESVFRFQVPN